MGKKTAYIQRFLQSEIRPMFRKQFLREDIGAAIAVVFVAIPLSLAVSLATGVGAEVGLISAVVGGILGAIFGGCRLGITGPAVAMSVLLAGTLQSFGFAGLLVTGLVCGILQLILGFFQLGRIAKYIPLSLVLAFAAGIGFLLFFEQLPHAFQLPISDGLTIQNTARHWHLYLARIGSASFGITALTVAILAFLPKFLPRAYAFFFATLIPMVLVYVLNLQVATIGVIPHNLIHFEKIDFGAIQHWHTLILTGVEVFILASLETLLSTSSVDLMGKGDLHNPSQELIGQGIANIGVTLMGGIPVTGIVARSSVNVLAGAKTRRSAIFHSLLIVLIVYLFPSLIEKMPIAVLAGILIAASFKMMNIRQVLELWKTDRLEVLVYVVTFVAIIATDLIDGIQTGLLAAFIIVGLRMLRTKAEIKLWTNNNVLRVSLSGTISFFSYEKLAKIQDYALSKSHIHFVIFEFNDVQNMDASGAKHLINVAQELANSRVEVIFHGMRDEVSHTILSSTADHCPFSITVTEFQVKDILEKSGVKHSAEDVLRHGITKYISNYAKDNKRLISTLAKGQKPHTLLITCSDSRLNPNAFFSADIGEIFIVRNVGNVVPPYMPDNIYSEIAAIEYAVSELGIRNVVVCGHTECGAIKASYDSGDAPLGYVGLDNWLGLIKVAFKLKKPRDVYQGVEINLLHQVENLKTYPGIAPLITSQELKINTWLYDVHSGQMLEWVKMEQKFLPIV